MPALKAIIALLILNLAAGVYVFFRLNDWQFLLLSCILAVFTIGAMLFIRYIDKKEQKENNS